VSVAPGEHSVTVPHCGCQSSNWKTVATRAHNHGIRMRAGYDPAEPGRSPLTICRERRGNRDPGGGQYGRFTAQRVAAGGGASSDSPPRSKTSIL
jgi:hypothetical protein